MAAHEQAAVSLADLPHELLAKIWSFLSLRAFIRARRISRAFVSIPVFFWARAKDTLLAELADARMPESLCAQLAAACAGLPCVDPVAAEACRIPRAAEAVAIAARAVSTAQLDYSTVQTLALVEGAYACVYARAAVVELAAADPAFRFWWPSGAWGGAMVGSNPALFRLVLARAPRGHNYFDTLADHNEKLFRVYAEEFPAEFAAWLRARRTGPLAVWTTAGSLWLLGQFQTALGRPLPPTFSNWLKGCEMAAFRAESLEAVVAFSQELGWFDAVRAAQFSWPDVVARTAAGPPRVYYCAFSADNQTTARAAAAIAAACVSAPNGCVPGIIAEFAPKFAADASRWAAAALVRCTPAQREALCATLGVSAAVGAADLNWLLQHETGAQTTENVCGYLARFVGDAAAALRAWLAEPGKNCWPRAAALAVMLAHCGIAGTPVRVSQTLLSQPALAFACGWRAELLENCDEVVASGFTKHPHMLQRMLREPFRAGLEHLSLATLAVVSRPQHVDYFCGLLANSVKKLGAHVLVHLARNVAELPDAGFAELLAKLDEGCLSAGPAGPAGVEDAIVVAIVRGCGGRARALLARWPAALRPARASRLFRRAVGRRQPTVLRALCGCNAAGFVPGPALGTYARAVACDPATIAALDSLCIGLPRPPR